MNDDVDDRHRHDRSGIMQRTSTSSPATSRRPGQLDLLQAQAGPGALFAYGTLQFPGVLSALLRRVPEHAAGTAVGWRAAELYAGAADSALTR
jgi:hypothetical protein